MKTAIRLLFALLLLTLTACQPPDPGVDEVSIEQPEIADVPELNLEGYTPAYMHEIIHPQPGEVIGGSPYLITYSGTSFGGIEMFEVWVDGGIVGTSPILGYGSGGPAYGHFFYSEFEWIPDSQGDHTIAVRAKASGFQMYSEFMEVEVTVAPSLTLSVVPEELPITLLPDCSAADLSAPALFAPEFYATLPEEMTEGPVPTGLFHWSHMGGCLPEAYTLRILQDPLAGQAWSRTTDGTTTTWPPEDELLPLMLEPATQYYWTAFASADGADGPREPAIPFFTGPECASAQDLVAPELIGPLDGEQVVWLQARLRYQAGGPKCLPDGYFVDLQTDPVFGGASLEPHLTHPVTNTVTPELDDCTTYFWRVAAVQDGVRGPYSEARSFHTDFEGTCPTLMAEGPWIEALIDQACYVGPDPARYPIAGYLLAGETTPILAHDLLGAWWAVENPDADGHCFVRKTSNESNGDTNSLPTWSDPEVAGPVCMEDLDQDACGVAGGSWVETVGRPPSCACP